MNPLSPLSVTAGINKDCNMMEDEGRYLLSAWPWWEGNAIVGF